MAGGKLTPQTAWVGSSILPGGFKVQWHTLSRWFANVEIYICLFVAFGVLLSPQNQQMRRKLRKDHLRPVDLRMTSRTESDHQMHRPRGKSSHEKSFTCRRWSHPVAIPTQKPFSKASWLERKPVYRRSLLLRGSCSTPYTGYFEAA